jgi:uncharacterized membrane protein
MKTNTASSLASKGILLHVLAYLLWLVSVVVCVAAVVQLRSTVNVLWVAFRGNRYSLGLVNQLSLILGGLAAFVYILFLEYYYRSSITRRGQKSQAGGEAAAHASAPPSGRIAQWVNTEGLSVLLRRFAITISVPLGLCVASLGALEIALRSLR